MSSNISFISTVLSYGRYSDVKESQWDVAKIAYPSDGSSFPTVTSILYSLNSETAEQRARKIAEEQSMKFVSYGQSVFTIFKLKSGSYTVCEMKCIWRSYLVTVCIVDEDNSKDTDFIAIVRRADELAKKEGGVFIPPSLDLSLPLYKLFLVLLCNPQL